MTFRVLDIRGREVTRFDSYTQAEDYRKQSGHFAVQDPLDPEFGAKEVLRRASTTLRRERIFEEIPTERSYYGPPYVPYHLIPWLDKLLSPEAELARIAYPHGSPERQ